jgi:hypothetical protein
VEVFEAELVGVEVLDPFPIVVGNCKPRPRCVESKVVKSEVVASVLLVSVVESAPVEEGPDGDDSVELVLVVLKNPVAVLG